MLKKNFNRSLNIIHIISFFLLREFSCMLLFILLLSKHSLFTLSILYFLCSSYINIIIQHIFNILSSDLIYILFIDLIYFKYLLLKFINNIWSLLRLIHNLLLKLCCIISFLWNLNFLVLFRLLFRLLFLLFLLLLLFLLFLHNMFRLRG